MVGWMMMLLALPVMRLGLFMALPGGGRGQPGEDREPDQAAGNEPTAEGIDHPAWARFGDDAAPPAPRATTRRVFVGGRDLTYQATVGLLPIRGEDGSVDARLFYTAYTLGDGDGNGDRSRERPLMFSFNGGPGSSSVWLHLGGLGPRRVAVPADGAMPPPPFRVTANEQTWLETSDLVFIDPVDTGYSRARTAAIGRRLRTVEGDVAAIGEFIRLYLTRERRWGSPLFLVGESYGTFRAAALAGYLIERGVAFIGLVLVSSVLDVGTVEFHPGNDLAYPLILPTYCAIAWYHGRLDPALQARPLPEVMAEVGEWAIADYLPALARGAGLAAERRRAVVERLGRYTGLTPTVIEQSNMRVEINRFRQELLRPEEKTVGRLDGRFAGYDPAPVEARRHFDPSLAAIRPPFTAALNDYLRSDLGYETDDEYQILRELEWGWGSAAAGYPTATVALADAFAKNPYLRLFVASGWYDLATPWFATDYTLAHLALSASARQSIQTHSYPVGHMVYLEEAALVALKKDVAAFVGAAVGQEARPLR